MSPINLTKSLYIQYLKCPTSMWLKKHAPEELPQPSEHAQFIMNQGIEFEELVRTTYVDGVHIESCGEEAVRDTKKAIANGAKIIFQATAIIDGYHVKADIFVRENAFPAGSRVHKYHHQKREQRILLLQVTIPYSSFL